MQVITSTTEAVDSLVYAIMNYKADDYFGNPSELEARAMAALMILDRCSEEIGYGIDGDMLTMWLDEARGSL